MVGLPSKERWKCQNLECLIMRNCKVTLQSKLDLKGFRNLRLLILTDYPLEDRNGMEILCTSDDTLHVDLNMYGRKGDNKGCLPELRMVKLFGLGLRHIPFLRQCWNLTFLSIDNCDFDTLDFPEGGTSLFDNLEALETLLFSSVLGARFPSYVFDGILQVATKLKNLKCLEIDLRHNPMKVDGFWEPDLSPLRALTSLQTLSFPNLPGCIMELKGLDQLSQLIELNLRGSVGYLLLPNLDLFPNLRWLRRFRELHSGHQQGLIIFDEIFAS